MALITAPGMVLTTAPGMALVTAQGITNPGTAAITAAGISRPDTALVTALGITRPDTALITASDSSQDREAATAGRALRYEVLSEGTGVGCSGESLVGCDDTKVAVYKADVLSGD